MRAAGGVERLASMMKGLEIGLLAAHTRLCLDTIPTATTILQCRRFHEIHEMFLGGEFSKAGTPCSILGYI